MGDQDIGIALIGERDDVAHLQGVDRHGADGDDAADLDGRLHAAAHHGQKLHSAEDLQDWR